MSTTTQHLGRTFTLTQDARDLPSLAADLRQRGFDGSVWYGSAPATGRQRVDLFGMFYRTTDGRFVAVT